MDLHCHLDLYSEPLKIIEEIRRRKTVVFSVTTTPTAFSETKSLAVDVPSIYTGIGLHPQIVSSRYGELEQIQHHMSDAHFVGEIGLDGGSEYRASWNQQVEVFRLFGSENISGRNLAFR